MPTSQHSHKSENRFVGDFIAIDFETASRRADSACQLAAVKVRNGKIGQSRVWMIRPKPFWFSHSNIRIHGIRPSNVENEPDFAGHWPDIAEFLGLAPHQRIPEQQNALVAHNASFDLGVLTACLQTHGQIIPEMEYTCTRSIARRAWPSRSRFGLKPLSNWLGHSFRHHDALEDSVACAKILIAAAIDRGAKTVPELERKLKLSRGTAGSWGMKGPSTRRRSRPQVPVGARSSSSSRASLGADTPMVGGIDLQRILIRSEFVRPFRGHTICFYGELSLMERSQAELLAERLGGTCVGDITDETTLVVIGSDNKGAPGKFLSHVHEADEAYQANASEKKDPSIAPNIEVLSEDDFLGKVVQRHS